MKCPKCNTDNRAEAVYCKHCGDKMPVDDANPFGALVGMAAPKREFAAYVDTVKSLRARGATHNVACNTLILGASGTGKSALAEAITKMLCAAGVVRHSEPTVVDAVVWDSFLDDWDNNVRKLKNRVLVIDNVQKLVREDDSTDVGRLDILFSEMDHWGGNPVVILLGLPAGFREFIDKSPEVRRRFEYVFTLPDYNAKELTDIIMGHLSTKYGVRIDSDVSAKVERVMMHTLRHKPEGWGNAHSAIRKADEIYLAMVRRGGVSVSVADVSGEEEREFSPDEIMARLDGFVGIDNIREEIQNMISEIEDDKARFGKEPEISSHFVFTGNPGTGKTTIARVFADILRAMKVLPTGQLIEADRSMLVSPYVGDTAVRTNELVDKAMGGVLFIDEAYTLASDGESKAAVGKEAIDTLLKRLEDDRGKFVCIVAGYTKEMFDFLQSNPGLQSRFNKTIEFKDYDGAALTAIFRGLVRKNGFTLDAAADANLRGFFDRMFAMRTKNFGNAREVNNVFKEAKQRQSKRLRTLREQGLYNPDMAFVLTRDDIEGDENTRELSLDDVLAEMERNFIGMDDVKELMRSIGRKISRQRMRMERGFAEAKPISLMLMLTGNPGTGKTTVARTLGKILKALKVLPTDKVIEVDKAGMIDQFVGGTPKKVNDVVDRAMGGILFIDEAYTLSQNAHSGADYGKEAIETLMKRMEDDRGKFVCIMAGYKEPMEGFIQVNPGIESRLTHRIHIEDYTADELLQIFLLNVRKSRFNLTDDARAAVEKTINDIVANKGANFGNARDMRNLFDMACTLQETRLDDIDEITDEQLMTLETSDIPTYEKFRK